MVALVWKLMLAFGGLGLAVLFSANVALAGSATGILDPGTAHRGSAESHCMVTLYVFAKASVESKCTMQVSKGSPREVLEDRAVLLPGDGITVGCLLEGSTTLSTADGNCRAAQKAYRDGRSKACATDLLATGIMNVWQSRQACGYDGT